MFTPYLFTEGAPDITKPGIQTTGVEFGGICISQGYGILLAKLGNTFIESSTLVARFLFNIAIYSLHTCLKAFH